MYQLSLNIWHRWRPVLRSSYSGYLLASHTIIIHTICKGNDMRSLFMQMPILRLPDWLAFVSPILGLLLAVWSGVTRLSSDNGIGVVILLLIGGCLVPLISAIHFQHVSFSARKMSVDMHVKSTEDFRETSFRELNSESDARTSDEAQFFSQLKTCANVHNSDILLTIYDSPKHYINVVVMGPKKLHAIVSSATLASVKISDLSQFVSEVIVFHELCSGDFFNPPKDAIPAKGIIGGGGNPFSFLFIALNLYIQAHSRLKKTDKALGVNAKTSFIKRQNRMATFFSQENQNWF